MILVPPARKISKKKANVYKRALTKSINKTLNKKNRRMGKEQKEKEKRKAQIKNYDDDYDDDYGDNRIEDKYHEMTSVRPLPPDNNSLYISFKTPKVKPPLKNKDVFINYGRTKYFAHGHSPYHTKPDPLSTTITPIVDFNTTAIITRGKDSPKTAKYIGALGKFPKCYLNDKFFFYKPENGEKIGFVASGRAMRARSLDTDLFDMSVNGDSVSNSFYNEDPIFVIQDCVYVEMKVGCVYHFKVLINKYYEAFNTFQYTPKNSPIIGCFAISDYDVENNTKYNIILL